MTDYTDNQIYWSGLNKGKWQQSINVRDFIQQNITPYVGDSSFMQGPTEATKELWSQLSKLTELEREKGILDADTSIISSIVSHGPGYIDPSKETIVGLQTDAPLKRAIMPYGGLRMVETGLKSYGFSLDESVRKIFTDNRKTHNEGVFQVYTQEMKTARKSGIITGLPDSYGRGRIIGDYRRVALYGVDILLEDKNTQKNNLSLEYMDMDSDTIRLREEVTDQITALEQLKIMAASYGFDISHPAKSAKEAIQWTYFAYLAAVKEQNGAAMSLGRVSSFFDIYIQNDLEKGLISEVEAQEMIDHFVMKLRIVRFLRTPSYDELFSGDPTWITECVGGMGVDGRTLVTKTNFRFMQTLYNLGPAPEPNITVLWSKNLPQNFKDFCAQVSIDTSALQYENDDSMRTIYGDDYGIACCVSPMEIGKQMQFFGARANIAKALLYAINGGRDEISGEQITPLFAPITADILNYDEVIQRYDLVLDWLAHLYISSLNVIHYMHDKYAYESLQMSLHDVNVERTSAAGIAGLSVVVDSLSAIKFAKVKPLRDETGLAYDYEIDGEFPCFGNDDDRVDNIAKDVVEKFMNKLRKHKTYRNARPTLSVLTITSNVVYGKKTGSTPDGRKHGEPFAPGANPMHGRDKNGALASLTSVAKIPYEHAEDGISYTFSIIPNALGKKNSDRKNNLIGIMDGYFIQGGHHININVFERETLIDAMEHPEKYPQLTIRVSGYAVNFVRLTKEQQIDVINRTFHEKF